jgi:F0F1-type ATP synthase assembly protein I
MAITIYLGNLLGIYLDGYFNTGSEILAQIITLIAVFLSTFMLIRQVINGNN